MNGVQCCTVHLELERTHQRLVGWTEAEEMCPDVAAVSTRGDTSQRRMPGLANAGARIWCTGLVGGAHVF